jgi:hypothetical protein
LASGIGFVKAITTGIDTSEGFAITLECDDDFFPLAAIAGFSDDHSGSSSSKSAA